MSLTIDLDDLGANHVISAMCQSHDCRDKLDALHYANPLFKVTLFAIPGEMTYELAEWCKANNSWVELAVHGFLHTSNFECGEITYEQFEEQLKRLQPMVDAYFVKGFKAPGWQISAGCYEWLYEHGWWVSDQSYNNDRRPKGLRTYLNTNGHFSVGDTQVDAWHGHTWDCVGNGIYESYPQVEQLVRNATDFKFVSELLA